MSIELGNKYYEEGKYEDAIKVYTELLKSDPENYLLLSNRSLVYIKLEDFKKAVDDAVKSTKLKPSYAKSWGRLGASLYGMNDLDRSLVAYNKANELEPLEIYQEMINQINKETLLKENNLLTEDNLNKFKDIKNIILNEESGMQKLFDKMVNSLLSNPKVMEKIVNPEIQEQVLEHQTNPLGILKDKEMLNLMNELLKELKF